MQPSGQPGILHARLVLAEAPDSIFQENAEARSDYGPDGGLPANGFGGAFQDFLVVFREIILDWFSNKLRELVVLRVSADGR